MSDLMKISRATADQHFQWRVAAAMVLHGQVIYAAANSGPKDKALALSSISNPAQPDIAMLALVASDPAVVAKITLDGEQGEVADTSGVADADIKRVVAAMWSPVAAKYSAGQA
jgi:hypothetical protein